MKMVLIALGCFLSLNAQANAETVKKEKGAHDIAIEIKIICPMSEEYKQFVESIPVEGEYRTDFTEWKSSFINNMNKLISLVESGNVCDSSWSVTTGDKCATE
jgi:hypothetical protein